MSSVAVSSPNSSSGATGSQISSTPVTVGRITPTNSACRRLVGWSRIVPCLPPVGCCDAVIVSPDTDPMPFTGSLAKHGILCASTGYPDRRTTEFYAKMRAAFRPIKPWREHLPGPLYGVLASPAGAPSRRRDPPGSARRLNTQYIPSLFVFGTDEVPLVFGGSNAKMTPTKPLITLDADVVEPSIKDELCSL